MGGIAVLAILALVSANGYDYFKFQQAIARVENLTESEKQEIGDFCRTPKQHIRFEAGDTPPALARLKPLRGSLRHGTADLLLYEHDEVSLGVWISTSTLTQTMAYYTNSSGWLKSKTVWTRETGYPRRLAPTGRRVTITGTTSFGDAQWIVTDDRISLVEPGVYVGGKQVAFKETPLTAEALQEITARIDSVKRFGGGCDFRSDYVVDGYALWICFTSDGHGGPEDIAIRNVIVPEISPLLELVAKYGPKGFPILYEKQVRSSSLAGLNLPTTRRTFAQVERELNRMPSETAWWCLWRKLAY